MKRLLVTASPSTAASVPLPPRRGKPLALSIPVLSSAASSPTTARIPYGSVSTPTTSAHFQPSRLKGLAHLHSHSDGLSDDGLLPGAAHSFSSSPEPTRSKHTLRSPFDPVLLDLETDALSHHLSEAVSLGSEDFRSTSLDARISRPDPRTDFSVEQYTLSIPEELQESSIVYAYPNGPANVLNSVLYLYLDPGNTESPLDINEYDMVINVARECEDLSAQFDDKKGKKYISVPWSHTSPILKQLPQLTSEIARMDKPGKKILVHCQCGVLRSACVVVAYFMVKFKLSVNEAYELLKSGTDNIDEQWARQILDAGNHVDACERICPNMSLIFELMDFGDRLAAST